METDYNANADAVKAERKIIRRAADYNSITIMIFLVLSQLLALGLSYLLSFLKNSMPKEYFNTIADYSGYVLMYFVAVPIAVLLINKKNKFKLRNFFSKPSMAKKDIFKWTLICYGLTMGVNLIFNTFFMLLQSFGVEMNVPQMPASDNWISVILSFIFVGFLAPVCEEIIFRGSILGNTAKCGEWFAIVMSGVFFGLTHTNYQQIFFAAAMGIIAGIVTIKAHSIIPSVIMHMSVNLFSTIQSVLVSNVDSRLFETEISYAEMQRLFVKNIGYLIPISFLACLSMVITIVGIILFFVEIAKRRNELKFHNNCRNISAADKTFIYITSPWTIALIILLLFMTALNLVGI